MFICRDVSKMLLFPIVYNIFMLYIHGCLGIHYYCFDISQQTHLLYYINIYIVQRLSGLICPVAEEQLRLPTIVMVYVQWCSLKIVSFSNYNDVGTNLGVFTTHIM